MENARKSISVVPGGRLDDPLAELRREELERQPVIGMAELRAAARLVAEGMATRVTLAGFAAWAGLLTEIERLSREYDLTIVPTVVHGGGRVDIVVCGMDGDDH